MEKTRPIGVMDSGVGGLSVLRALQKAMPQEDFLYIGDTARAPYGVRDRETICRFVGEMTDWLERQEIRQLVVACNTITVLGEETIRAGHSFPVIGMSRGVESVLQATKNKKVGVLATDFTVQSGAHKRDIQAVKPSIEVFAVGCTKFVPLIEGDRFDTPELAAAVNEYADILKARGVDTVVLGCTHYPFIRSGVEQAFGPEVTIIDPAEETALRAKRQLQSAGQLKEQGRGHCVIGFTGDVALGKRLAQRMVAADDACEFVQIRL